MHNDTIAAVATPPGVGGIAVIRLSGPDALTVALGILSVHTLQPRHATYCSIADIDDGIATYFTAPHSFTGEETVELACHGSLYLQQAILAALIDRGARLAQPGEFTLRAFRNGKLNLSQAEALADLIHATTPQQHSLAVSQLRGAYAHELQQLRQQLLDLTALLELELDFSQEDVEFADRTQLSALIQTLTAQIGDLRQSFRTGNALKHGIPVAIIGRPNAGKSSLLNALLRDDRAIVSPTPGTTRDTIEETFSANGLPFRIIDTAGLRHTDDPIEALGVQRAITSAAQADIILYVHDATCPFSQALDDLQQLRRNGIDLDDKHLLIACNKIDLTPDSAPRTPQLSTLNSQPSPPTSSPSPPRRGAASTPSSKPSRPSTLTFHLPPLTPRRTPRIPHSSPTSATTKPSDASTTHSATPPTPSPTAHPPTSSPSTYATHYTISAPSPAKSPPTRYSPTSSAASASENKRNNLTYTQIASSRGGCSFFAKKVQKRAKIALFQHADSQHARDTCFCLGSALV